jgi:rRNA maturation endonuclease Nob1
VNSLRNPHQCLIVLDDFRTDNLLAHLPLNIRSVASRSEAAKNTDWMTKTYFERISLNTQ